MYGNMLTERSVKELSNMDSFTHKEEVERHFLRFWMFGAVIQMESQRRAVVDLMWAMRSKSRFHALLSAQSHHIPTLS